jgi:transposase
MGHKGPVLRSSCTGRGRARTQIPLNSIQIHTHTKRKTWEQVIAAEVFGDVSEALEEKYRHRPLRFQSQCAKSCLLEEPGAGVLRTC